MKADPMSGVKAMTIAGRTVSQRERLIGMTDEERAWRAQWLKDQRLSPNEPRHVPEMYKALNNPIRRLYKFPLDKLAEVVQPYLGMERTIVYRYCLGKMLMGIYGIYIITYCLKYNGNDWTRIKGWRVKTSRVAILEGDPGYPKVSEKSKPQDYAKRGFDEVTLKL